MRKLCLIAAAVLTLLVVADEGDARGRRGGRMRSRNARPQQQVQYRAPVYQYTQPPAPVLAPEIVPEVVPFDIPLKKTPLKLQLEESELLDAR